REVQGFRDEQGRSTGKCGQRTRMQVVVMAVRDIDKVDRRRFEWLKRRPWPDPPLGSEARSSPPGIGKNPDTACLDEQRGMTNIGDFHYALSARPDRSPQEARSAANRRAAPVPDRSLATMEIGRAHA